MSAVDRGRMRWVPEDNYHLTLLFVGEVSEPVLDELAEAINDRVDLIAPELSIAQVSPFPESSPKLLAALVEETAELSRLHKQIKSAAASVGLQPEKRRFRPHVTLARQYPRRGQQLIPAAVDKLQDVAEQLIIYQSHLLPDGTEYQPLYEYDLS